MSWLTRPYDDPTFGNGPPPDPDDVPAGLLESWCFAHGMGTRPGKPLKLDLLDGVGLADEVTT